jgi:predicted amidophosphoribosyltransferase
MTTVREVALPLATICAPVPRVGDGICDRCHRPPNPPYTRCWSCEQVESQVSQPCSLVVPISLYEVGLQLHYQLKHYKDDDGSERTRDFMIKTAAMLGYFLQRHNGCIAAAADGAWDIITSVPSSADRPGEHPLATAIRLVPSLREQYEPLLRRGSTPPQHNAASDAGYEPVRAFRGERVLLVDDTFTSGARAQSAASALNNAGATVAAIVPIGRVISPEYNGDFWKRQSRLVFDFDVCCVGDHE